MPKGIVDAIAPELRGVRWIDAAGEPRSSLELAELGVGYKVLYFFQYWCGGCHEYGFPALKTLVDELDTQAGFAVVQTVFEGGDVNTFDRLPETQQRYGLALPFGHAEATGGALAPAVMTDYRSGGTPWFVVIAPGGRVVFNDYQLDPKGIITAVSR